MWKIFDGYQHHTCNFRAMRNGVLVVRVCVTAQ